MTEASLVGIQIPRVLLPQPEIDLTRWAVIACDQYTSQPEYWQQVENIVANSPSTYHLILPEVFLGTPEEDKRVEEIQGTMSAYLQDNVFEEHPGMIYVERKVGGKTRRGIMLCLDLESYDFNAGSSSLIRATEGTILERLPPRMKIRSGAPLEVPHILVLIDDPGCSVITPIENEKANLELAYDFELMLGSGHLTGYKISDTALELQVIAALQQLADPAVFSKKYQVDTDQKPLLFAVGDGNHSLATAKMIWENLKPSVGPDHPARYSLVEIENVHDEGLVFEPIHRVLFNINGDVLRSIESFFPGQVRYQPSNSVEELMSNVESGKGSSHCIGFISGDQLGILEIRDPRSNLPVGTLQTFLDSFLKSGGAEKIDYVHGNEVVFDLGKKPNQCGFYLPALDKTQLFRTVILDGALPRKTFSMGEAYEKRFYLEARKII